MTPMSDHDLLIRLDTKLDSFMGRISDHERRLRRVELSTLGVLTTAIALAAKIFNII